MLKKIVFILVLSACGCTSSVDAPARRDSRAQLEDSAFPPMKSFSGTRIIGAKRSNSQIAQDFLDLSFRLESGRTLKTISRFEGPITLRISGHRPAGADRELSRLLGRLKNEAGIDIEIVSSKHPASLNIETISRRTLQRHLPNAACFVVPRLTSWADYKKKPAQ